MGTALATVDRLITLPLSTLNFLFGNLNNIYCLSFWRETTSLELYRSLKKRKKKTGGPFLLSNTCTASPFPVLNVQEDHSNR
jgi:hypothetical protein